MPISKYSVSVSIMAHPSRSAAAEQLRSSFQQFEARICYDPDPCGERSTLRTARLAWRPWSEEVTHHLVLQDDVTLTEDFETCLLRVIEQEPDAALGLFSEWGSYTSYAVRLALLSGHAWTESVDSYFPTVAAVLPCAVARGLATHLGTAEGGIDDVEAFSFLSGVEGLRSLVTIPHLVQHDGDVSLVGNEAHGVRRATVFDAGMRLDASWWQRPRLEGIRRIAVLNFAHEQPLALDRSRPGCGRGDKSDLGAGFADCVSRNDIEEVWRPLLRGAKWIGRSEGLNRRFEYLVEVAAYTALAVADVDTGVDDVLGDHERLCRLVIGSWAPGVMRLHSGFRPADDSDRAEACLRETVDSLLEAQRTKVLPALTIRQPTPRAST